MIEHDVTVEELEEALETAAILYALDGEVFLPLFQEVEKRLNKRKGSCPIRERASLLARNALAGKQSLACISA